MVRHMVFFAFKPSAGAEQRRAILTALAGFPDRFPTMRDFQLGANVSKRDATYSHAMTMTFEDLVDLEAYLDSHEHEDFVKQIFGPAIAGRSIVSFVD